MPPSRVAILPPPSASSAPHSAPFYLPVHWIPVTHTTTLSYGFLSEHTACPIDFPNSLPATVGGSVTFLLPFHSFSVCWLRAYTYLKIHFHIVAS